LPSLQSAQSSILLGNSAYLEKRNSISVYCNRIELFDRSNTKQGNFCPERHQDDIRTFSRHSRMRMMKLCASVNLQNYADCFHVTLTYHNNVPKTVQIAKKHFSLFIKKLNYHSSEFDYIYRIELQKRLAPHFHILFFFKSKFIENNLELRRLFLVKLWKSTVKEIGIPFDLHSVLITRCQDARKFMCYVSKYSAKIEEKELEKFNGRRWGYSQTLDMSVLQNHIESDEFLKFFKIKLFNFLKNKMKLSEEFEKYFFESQTISIFITSEQFLEIYSKCFFDFQNLNSFIKKKT
jgi:hypothetical protein